MFISPAHLPVEQPDRQQGDSATGKRPKTGHAFTGLFFASVCAHFHRKRSR
jgi:hypothetical protein